MSEHRKLRLNTAGSVVLTSLLTTVSLPSLAGLVLRAMQTAEERLQVRGIGLDLIWTSAQGFLPEAVNVALYAWLICWIWTRSPDVLR